MRHLIAYLLAGLVLAGPAQASAEPVVRVVVLQDHDARFDVRALLADPSLRAFRAVSGEFGLASCLSAWRDRPAQAAACVQSRLPSRELEPMLALRASVGSAAGLVTVDCIGRGRVHQVQLNETAPEGNGAALKACLERSLEGRAESSAPDLALRSGPLLAEAGRLQAAARAPWVLRIAVDHVGQPRGYVGPCHVAGRIHAVRRGADPSLRGVVEFSVTCSHDGRGRGGAGAIPMGAFREGTFADLYLDQDWRVVDVRVVQP